MRANLAIIAAAVVVVAFAPQRSAAQEFPPPLIKVEGLRQISNHVHVIPDDSIPLIPNIGFVAGDTGVLVVDTGLGARNGAAVAAVAQRLAQQQGGARTLYLVTTHFHPEHDLGAHGFPAATKMIRSTDQEKDIAEFGLQLAQVFKKFSPLTAELLEGATFRKADVTFASEHALDLGGVKVRLIAAGPNHTRGDTAIWVESDRVLFSGDLAMKGLPAFASPHSSLRHWLGTLDRLAALKPGAIVPSHGPSGDAAFIATYRAYLTEVRDRTAGEKRGGRSVEQAVEAVTSAMSQRYRDLGRLAGAIRAAYAEAP